MSETHRPSGATPHPAATITLVRRENGGSFKVYMNRRLETMDTYAGVYVFPGGRVETDDWSAAMLALTHGLTPAEAQIILGVDENAEMCLGYWVAAIRELFEEAGVYFFLSAENESSSLSGENQTHDRVLKMRRALQAGETEFSSLLTSERLLCDVGRLTYFYHRITPEHYRVRFDTRFYLAALPPGQEPVHSSAEVAASVWVTPREALQRSELGEFPIMPPTRTVLSRLAEEESWEQLCAKFFIR